jgi:hypothetical protein
VRGVNVSAVVDEQLADGGVARVGGLVQARPSVLVARLRAAHPDHHHHRRRRHPPPSPATTTIAAATSHQPPPATHRHPSTFCFSRPERKDRREKQRRAGGGCTVSEAPRRRRRRTVPGRPARTATWSGLAPASSWAHGVAPRSSRRPTHSSLPTAQALARWSAVAPRPSVRPTSAPASSSAAIALAAPADAA